MLNSTRTIIELVARHGNLSIFDFRNLTLLNKSLTVPKEELERRKLRDEYGTYYISTKNEIVRHGWFERVWIDSSNARRPEKALFYLNRLHIEKCKYDDGYATDDDIFRFGPFKYLRERHFDISKEIDVEQDVDESVAVRLMCGDDNEDRINYYKNGSLWKAFVFKNSQTREYIVYNANGTIKARVQYNYGRPHGTLEAYRNGVVAGARYYKFGFRVPHSVYNALDFCGL